MNGAEWFDRGLAEWDTDPEYLVEGVLLVVNQRICATMRCGGITRTELAKRLGTSPAYVTKLLNGQPNMSLKTLTRIAVALGKGIEVFIPSSAREEEEYAESAQRHQHPRSLRLDTRGGEGMMGVVLRGQA